MLKAGFCRLDVSPPLGIDMPGYYERRCSKGFHDPLTVTAIALDNGEEKAVLFTVDAIGITMPMQDKMKQAVALRCAMSEHGVFIACTHTHTGCHLDGSDRMDADYERHFIRKLTDCAQLACGDAKPVQVYISRGEAKDIAFVRRFRMKDGSTQTNPGLSNPHIDHAIGEPDETVQLIVLKQEMGKEIILVNFQVHPDVVGGELYAPDYPGFVRKFVEEEMENTCCAYFNGCQGDTNHVDVRLPKGSLSKGIPIARHMGRVIADGVKDAYTRLMPVDNDRIGFDHVEFWVPANSGSAEEVEEAKIWKQDFISLPKGEFLKKYGSSARKKQITGFRLVKLAEKGCIGFDCTLPLRVMSIRFGDIVFTAMPGEPFTEIGRQIKATSPFAMCVVCCCANGYEGYFPLADALDGYEGMTCNYKPGVAETLIEKAIILNKSLYQK
ncbi:MAG TPA: hypothetical protein DCY75_05915 [Clostridiales bacterium]|jgi:hypothetical protein|nr:hypothetical protein [Clostridiales bacterium]